MYQNVFSRISLDPNSRGTYVIHFVCVYVCVYVCVCACVLGLKRISVLSKYPDSNLKATRL